jgi:hypothetical protein
MTYPLQPLPGVAFGFPISAMGHLRDNSKKKPARFRLLGAENPAIANPSDTRTTEPGHINQRPRTLGRSPWDTVGHWQGGFVWHLGAFTFSPR